MSFLFRGSNPDIRHDEIYDAPIFRYQNISDVPWFTFSQTPGKLVRIIIQKSAAKLPLDVLYIPRDHPDLLVGLHGSVAPEKQSEPVFQFVTSFRAKRGESLLFLSDSTILQHEKLRIGWTVGNQHQDIASYYSELIQSLLDQTAVRRAVLVGHSAGGFAAVKIGSMIPHSHAVSVNGQFSLGIHRDWDVKRIHQLVFPEFRTHNQMIHAYPSRFDLQYVLSMRGSTSKFTWFSHKHDHLSFGDYPHFPAICDFFELGEHGGSTSQGDAIILTNYESPSRNLHGLPGTVIPFIETALGENPSMDLHIETSFSDVDSDQS